jgi:5-methylcytosine-specific restriction endonuclease McrA
MPWEKTAADRKAENAFYNDPVYKRNKVIVLRQAGGRCSDCGHRHQRLQVDHGIPRAQGGGHELANLSAKCSGDGSCKCHEKKTATEGRGYRNPASRTTTARDPKPKPRTRW